ncbi:MAG: formate dehydrogenase accessory sulfurtransferase FdhD [Phycisphaerales bacterium]|nr:formate dehydrogenase accessory sulfurtransferase FdhD [Phycisphaerales bacterium]
MCDQSDQATRSVVRWRVDRGAPPAQDRDPVVIEQALTLSIDEVGSFTLMCTPIDVEALAVGFAYTEGLIEDCDDVVQLGRARRDGDAGPLVIGMQLDDPSRAAGPRNLIVTSSCGLCGNRNIEGLLAHGGVGDELRIPPERINHLARVMHDRQTLFHTTGGTHAAAIFDPDNADSADGELLAMAEDIGRHNALDKAIGMVLLDGRTPAGCGAILSGRISMEIVAKAVRAGLELIAAVSAPTSLAVDAAHQCNITLCSFVRDDRLAIYTHPHRIIGMTPNARNRSRKDSTRCTKQ